MKKGRKILCGVVALSLLLGGCSGETGKKESDVVTIDIWTYYNGDQLTAFDGLVKEFNETIGKEKGIVVESYSQGSVTDLEENVLAAVRGEVGADEVPDIFAAYADTAYTVDDIGKVVDLSEYLTKKEIDTYIDGYITEGDFSGDGEIKIFPTAKSTEVLVLNKTDWDVFAKETGVSYENLADMDGLVKTAQLYYEWTDKKTPEVANDGKALFGRDAMANYMLIGGMQLGTEIFQVEDGKMALDFNKATIRKLWDYYYVPFVKGYFAATGRFRSDDIKTGNVISYVGSSSGATFFPDTVNINDTESYDIEMKVLPCPQFVGGQKYAVQQGAGMVVTKGKNSEIEASVEFLKWFTDEERNIRFSVQSGYLPVTKSANNQEKILKNSGEISHKTKDTLSVAVDTVNKNQLYTTKAFESGTEARNILEYAMSDQATQDREKVVELLQAGKSLEEAVAEYVTDEYFDRWYEKTLQQLQKYED